MIEFKSVSGGETLRGTSVFIRHCEYELRPIHEHKQYEVRQYWQGRNSRILLKSTRAEDLDAAKARADGWDAVHER